MRKEAIFYNFGFAVNRKFSLCQVRYKVSRRNFFVARKAGTEKRGAGITIALLKETKRDFSFCRYLPFKQNRLFIKGWAVLFYKKIRSSY